MKKYIYELVSFLTRVKHIKNKQPKWALNHTINKNNTFLFYKNIRKNVIKAKKRKKVKL